MHNYQVENKLLIKLTSADSTNIRTVYIEPYQRLGYQTVNENITIKDLSVRTFVESFDSVPFPTFDLELSDSEIQLAMFKIEWQSFRAELEILTSQPDTPTEWENVGLYSILNTAPLPYREFKLDNIKLGESNLAVRMKDVGYGVLTSLDKIIISGIINRDVWMEKVSPVSSLDLFLTPGESLQVLPPNTQRTGITVKNSSPVETIFLDINPAVTGETHMVELPPESFWESNFSIHNAVYLFCANNPALVHVREF